MAVNLGICSSFMRINVAYCLIGITSSNADIDSDIDYLTGTALMKTD